MRLANIIWLLFTLSFILILFYSPSPFMMLGLIIGLFIGVDLQILEEYKGVF
jgi:hypothetical protein